MTSLKAKLAHLRPLQPRSSGGAAARPFELARPRLELLDDQQQPPFQPEPSDPGEPAPGVPFEPPNAPPAPAELPSPPPFEPPAPGAPGASPDCPPFDNPQASAAAPSATRQVELFPEFAGAPGDAADQPALPSTAPARARRGLARSLASLSDAAFRPRQAPGAPAAPPRPSLDDLRDRIARIVARGLPPTPRADPTHGELPFVLETTERGPLYVHRARSGAAARVGRVPLVAARDAEAGMLALLALDPALAGCDVRRALFLDTETTGLAGGTGTVPFLVGLAWYDEASGAFMLEQMLLRRLGEEAPILALLTERIEAASMLVTFNGKAFDMPLLRTRYVMNRMPAPPDRLHLDLVHVGRRIHKHRLKVRTLVALEHNVLGRVRVGDTHGEDIVACYAHFLRTGDEEALAGVVEHNAADVLAMVALVGLYGEPLGSLEGEDLAGVARTLWRAGAIDRAAELAEEAVARGGGAEAKKARGEIAKARGDKARALADFEAIAEEVDDPTVRLSLAKLYEHHVRSFAKALSLLDRGTGEDAAALEKRRARLERKLRRKLERLS